MLKQGTDYTGDFICGKKHGKGIFQESTGAVYEGDFI
jgi:hypothetical protein